MHTHLENSPAHKGQSKKSNESNSPVSKPSQVLVKAQLEMTTPGDSAEREADAVADSIVTEGKIARSVSTGHSGTGIALPSQFASRISSFQGQGSRIAGDLKTKMESGFGRDFSNVRLHTDNAAAEMSSSISAKAFTYGNDIFFNRGQYSPDTKDGQHLIAHELTHVVQGKRVGRIPSFYSNDPYVNRHYTSYYQHSPQWTYSQARNRPPLLFDEDDPKPVNADNIGRDIEVTSTEQEGDLKDRLKANPFLQERNYTSITLSISSSDQVNLKNHNATGLDIIEKRILPACGGLITLAKQMNEKDSFDNNVTRMTGMVDFAKKVTKQFVKQLVQQLYNTLSQVSVAMDMFPKSYDSNMAALKKTAWVSCRNEFVKCVKRLAALAKNPAIGVLMYEGTYYPNDFPSDLTKATKKLISDDDFSMVLYHGAVCNTAAYGSVLASGADYQYEPGVADDDRLKIVGLAESGTSRSKWGNYNLQGSGVGSDALDHAKQGDVVLFWHYSKIEDGKIMKKNSTSWSVVNGLKKKMDEAKKEKDNAKKSELESKTAAFEKAKREYYDAHADYVLSIDHDAHHTEIIVGIRDNAETHQKEYLLSGAHGSAQVNGFSRKRGNLAWKSAEEIRDGGIMRCLPMDNESDLITVDIPSIMQKQKYRMQRDAHNNAAAKQYSTTHNIEGIKTLEGLRSHFKNEYPHKEDFDAQYALVLDEINELKTNEDVKKGNIHGEYSWRGNPVYVYDNQNTSKSVAITWFEIETKPTTDDASNPHPEDLSSSQE